MRNFKKFIKVVTITGLLVGCSTDEAPSTIDTDGDLVISSCSLQAIECEILTRINAHRKSLNLEILTLNDTANELSVEHTEYMISINDINHDNFDDRSDALFSKEKAIKAGENVASGHSTAQAVVNGWLNSDGHRRNIEGDFKFTGIAAIKNEGGRYFYTQIFFKQ